MSGRIRLAVATAVLGATASFGLASAHGSADPGFTVIGHQTDVAATGVSANAPPPPGATFVLREDLVQYPRIVGWDQVACTVGFRNWLICTATLTMSQGTLSGTGAVPSNASPGTTFDFPITGGTGLWDQVRGSVHATVADNGNTVYNVDID
jgi:hypothetical protein